MSCSRRPTPTKNKMSNVIIGAPAEATNEEQEQFEPLSPQVARRIAHAVARLHELEDQKIATPTSDAEIKGLREFVNNSFQRYAPELLGAYFTVKGEYEVLVNVLAVVFRRVDGFRDQMRFQEAAQRAAQAVPQQITPEAAALKASQETAKA